MNEYILKITITEKVSYSSDIIKSGIIEVNLDNIYFNAPYDKKLEKSNSLNQRNEIVKQWINEKIKSKINFETWYKDDHITIYTTIMKINCDNDIIYVDLQKEFGDEKDIFNEQYVSIQYDENIINQFINDNY